MPRTLPDELERPLQNTLEGYLLQHRAWGIVDFHLRSVVGPEGEVDFYIHPQGKDGSTHDFTVDRNQLKRLAVGAGSKATD